jgi:glycosyltransferase involved in cell wall biosynthesis
VTGDPPRAAPRLTFLFRSGRRERLERGGVMPTEFFYGYLQLKEQGHDVHYLEDADIGMGPSRSAFVRLLNKTSGLFGNLPIGMICMLIASGRTRRLDDAGTIVTTTNSMGLALAFGRTIGLVRAPVLLLVMGLMPKPPGPIKRRIFAWLLRNVRLVCISTAEQTYLGKLFPHEPIAYVPFGADAAFWVPADEPTGGYVLAIGNDPMRDWRTLVSAWSDDLPPLKIVTSLPVPAGASNIEVIRGDWRAQVLSDEAIRGLYQGARFVVVPLHDTVQPSGQSVCLQAMACGRAVIVSDIAGLWNRDLMVDGETVLLSPPGDAEGLRSRVMRLTENPDLAARLGRAGRQVVETHLNTKTLASSLAVAAQLGCQDQCVAA